MSPTHLPDCGAVLGVDIGFSAKKRSSAVCRLDWTHDTFTWAIQRFHATDIERRETLARFVDRPLLAAALDGPLRKGFDEIGKYRLAESMLTRSLQPFIGKPGQSSAPVGRKLNDAANKCAVILIEQGSKLQPAKHPHAINELAITEAFPSSFMGLLIQDPKSIICKRNNRSNLFFLHLSQSGAFESMLEHLLPGRRPPICLSQVTNRDERASLVCAMTALCVASMDYTAVGDNDGWIILPPRKFIQPWGWSLLEANDVNTDGLNWYPDSVG